MEPYTGEKPSTETVPEEAQILDLLNKDFKSAITNMFKEQKKIMSKDLLESMRISSHQMENINKEIKIT